MVRIRTGINSNDPRDLNKTVNFSGGLRQARLKMPTDLVSPTFMLHYVAGLENINYIYCETWGRYYFVDNITFSAGETIEFECSIDVLMSHKAAIEELKVNVIRQENKQNKFLDDSEYCLASNFQYSTRIFPKRPLSDVRADARCYCLTVMGGADSHRYIKLLTPGFNWESEWRNYYVLINNAFIPLTDLTFDPTPPTYSQVVSEYGAVYSRIGG